MRTTRRTVAVVGAMVAVGATTLMGIAAGTASAQAPGRCLENVNVRAEPSIDARIVAVCEAGTAVQTDAIRNGFVQLTDLGGWAAAEYIEVDGQPAGAPGSAPRSSATPSSPAPSGADDDDAAPATSGSRPSDDVDAPARDDADGLGGESTDQGADQDTDQDGEQDEPAEPAGNEGSGGALGGLL
jgi:uncharacterized protein YraI